MISYARRCMRSAVSECWQMHAFGTDVWVMPAAPLPEAASDPEDPPPDELALLRSARASFAGVKDAALARAPVFQRPTTARPKEICGCSQVRWRSTPDKCERRLALHEIHLQRC